jgi:hypothetical protein
MLETNAQIPHFDYLQGETHYHQSVTEIEVCEDYLADEFAFDQAAAAERAVERELENAGYEAARAQEYVEAMRGVFA